MSPSGRGNNLPSTVLTLGHLSRPLQQPSGKQGLSGGLRLLVGLCPRRRFLPNLCPKVLWKDGAVAWGSWLARGGSWGGERGRKQA